MLDENYIFYVCNQRKSSYVINQIMTLTVDQEPISHPFCAIIMPAIDAGGDGGFTETKLLARMDNVFSADELHAELEKHWVKHKPRLVNTQASYATIQADRQIKEDQHNELAEAMMMDKMKDDEKNRQKQDEQEAKAIEASKKQAEDDEQGRAVKNRKERGTKVPEEPPQGHKPCAKIQISFPDGSKVMRRFFGENLVESLYDFVDASEGLVDRPVGEDFELVCTYPRKVLDKRVGQTMKEADLCPQSAVIVNMVDDAPDSPENSP